MTAVVFAKAPVPGKVKTRLAKAMGDEKAAELYAAFVTDIVTALMDEPGFTVTVSASPDTSHPFFAELVNATGCGLSEQPGGDLGERQQAALKAALESGAQKAVLIGTDLPTVPMDSIQEAIAQLDHTPVVLCPSGDGGYWLVGVSRSALARWDDFVKRLMVDIPWSTGTVLRDSLARAGDLPVALGPCWYDVDDGADLDMLIRHLASPNPPDRPRTRALLTAWGLL